MPQQRITYRRVFPAPPAGRGGAHPCRARLYCLSGSSGGGGGGGGGGAGGAGVDTGGGIGAVPGFGIGGSSGVPVSTCTHDDRSKNMNSSAFSCGVMSIDPRQPFGKGTSGCEPSAPVAPRTSL